jgi:hypothetical protein
VTANPRPAPEDLRRLAAAEGVVTSYSNEGREPVEVDAEVVIGVLGCSMSMSMSMPMPARKPTGPAN